MTFFSERGLWLNVCIFDQRSHKTEPLPFQSHLSLSEITRWFLLVWMTANICNADVSLSNARGLAPLCVCIRINTVLQMLIIIQESSLIPKMPLWPLPWPQMNKDLHWAAAVHEMQLFSAAVGLYVTVFPKHRLSLPAVACSKGKHLVIKARRCFLHVATCSLIEGMFGCWDFTEDKQKMKAMQADCQNLLCSPGRERMQSSDLSSRWQFVSLFRRRERTGSGATKPRWIMERWNEDQIR